MSRRRRLLVRGMAGLLAALLVVLLGAVLVVRSDWFHNRIRERIVAEVERATGGRVEIGAFRFRWRELRAEISDLVIHGTEPPGHRPLFRAATVTVGLRVVSVLHRDVNIALLDIERPELSIEVNRQGETNLPRRRAPAAGNLLRPIINLAIQKFRLRNGLWRYASQTVPFAFSGNDLEARATYDPAGPGYSARLKVKQLDISRPQSLPVAFGAEMELAIRPGQVRIEQARLTSAHSTVTIHGTINNMRNPLASLTVQAELAMADLAGPLRLPLAPVGSVRVSGKVSVAGADRYSVEATATAADLTVKAGRTRVSGMSGSASIHATPRTIVFSNLILSALDGRFTGGAVLEQFQSFTLEGALDGFSLQRLAGAAGVRNMVWNGVLSGPVLVQGGLKRWKPAGLKVQGKLAIAPPAGGGVPVKGLLDFSFDQAGNRIEFGPSHLAFQSSRIDFSGTPGQGIRLSIFSENLDDFLPALALAGHSAAAPLPIRLERGVAQFAGVVFGPPANFRLAGHTAIGPLRYRGHLIDQVTADFELTRNRLWLRALNVRQGPNRLGGEGEVSLDDWKLTGASKLSGELKLQAAQLRTVLANFNREALLSGSATATATLSGTVAEPIMLATCRGKNLTAHGETIDDLRAGLRYSSGWLRIERGRLQAGRGRLDFQGAYRHPPDEWNNGKLSFDVSAGKFRLGQWNAVRKLRAGLDGAIQGRFRGEVQFRKTRPRLVSLAGNLSIIQMTMKKRALGNLRLTANTRRNVLIVNASAGLMQARIQANAQWSLRRESFGLGQIEFRDLTLSTLQDVGLFGGPETNLRLEGVMDGEIGFTGPVLEPAHWRGLVKITRLEITPAGRPGGNNRRDLTLRNSGSLLFSIDPAKITVRRARLVSPDTNLEVTGRLSYLRKNPWNLHLKGSANLAVLTAFRTDLSAEGNSTVNVVIHGSLLHPQIDGRLRFSNGSFYLRGLPNGIEQVNGTILFDRTRATIEKFSSRTGGGKLLLTGFIGFGGDDWVYHLQATAEKVRVRYPAGVSTQLNAQLDLTGSSTRSLLSGEVSIVRAAFYPSTDLGSILAASTGGGLPGALSNPFLRGMQFDIHVTTATNAEFLTSLTRDIELEADLRVRGSPARPAVLGHITVNRGVIQFFGTRYTIMQGDIRFFNPIKIEPILAMDLETKVRGYTVMINFSGPLDKLNFSYRSDPPLESQEIIALLTVGRTPGYAGMATRQTNLANQSFLQAGGNSLLGQALAAPVSSRLQRFFGVSRIKIDPQLIGVDNTPETQVTVEQQISRTITLTYVTNLARTQQQIVRVEWDFHPFWSVYAVRDSNGVFGVDFVYRRRFK